MKMSIRKVLILVLALVLVCGLAVSGSAVMIGDGALYHEYVLVNNALILEEHRAVASVDIEDTYGGLDMSNTGTVSLEYQYFSHANQYYISDTQTTTRVYQTGTAVLKQVSGYDKMKWATGRYDIRLSICGTSYRFRPADLHLTDEDY